MAVLRIERVPVQIARLGWFGMDHMHLVLDVDVLGSPQDNWWVMEGARVPGGDVTRLGVIGENGTTTLSQSYGGLTGDALQAVIGQPAWRGSRIIDRGGNELFNWVQMAGYASDIEAQNFPYVGLASPLAAISTINSSSVVASLLYSIGVDITEHLPSTLRLSPGYETLLGTTGNDDLTLQWGFRNAYGGKGDDDLQGTETNILPERLYGGVGDDVFHSTSGVNWYHGGQYGTDYREDGVDTIAYKDIDLVTVSVNRGALEHSVADFEVVHTSGLDRLFSIERLIFDALSTEVIMGPGVNLINDNLRIDMGDQSSLDQGDHLNFSGSDVAIIVNVDAEGHAVVQAQETENDKIGIWIESMEWLTGSPEADQIYTANPLLGVEGGAGSDLIDTRLATAFSGASPQGYDIEVLGGEGDDTIVAGSGRTLAQGGEGADRFILSAVTPFAGTELVEFVIEDGAASDRVYIPYDLFNLTYADFEGSQLFPLLGAMAQQTGMDSFADLPQNLGPWTTGPAARDDFFKFEWELQNDRHFGNDQVQGVIEFTGGIFYNRDGSDLLIHVFQGDPIVVDDVGSDELPWTHTVNIFYPETETIIRVVDFEEGDLGIVFHDPGVPDELEIVTDHGPYTVLDYPGWDTAVNAMTNGGSMEAPLDPRPAPPVYELDEVAPGEEPPLVAGTGNDDIIVAAGAGVRIDGGGGNDTMTGTAGNDVLDGGSGNDTMTGGSGNDIYLVDQASDVIVESATGGRDRAVTTTGYTLADGVEDLELDGAAVTGTGNAGANTLRGSAEANTLAGLAGNDHLIGGLGDDTLVGGEGSDTYSYTAGEGDDTIRDVGVAADDDALVLDDLAPDDVSLFRLASAPLDLIIALPDASRIRIENYGGPEGGGIERIIFSGGQQWSKAELAARAEAAPVITNDQPLARDDFNFLAASGVVTIPAADLLANDRDPDGGAVSIVAVGNVSAGATVSVLPSGDLLLTTAEGFDGSVTFTYTISDGNGGTSAASVEIGVIPNHTPVATGTLAPATTAAGQLWTYSLPAGFFSDADLNPLSTSASLAGDAPLPSWLAFDSATQTFSGTPPAGFTGMLDLVVTASDGLAAVSAPLQLTVGSGNRNPVAVADSATTQEYVPILIAASVLLANDTDADSDTLVIQSVQGAVRGTVALDGNGDVVFTPEAGYTGPASFTYTVSDGNGGNSTATVDVAVTAAPAGQTITGTSLGETLTGTAGSDTIEGRGGGDTLIGNTGNDTFLVVGSDGLDTYDGGYGVDTIRGGAGNDIIGLAAGTSSLAGIEAIDGGDGTDILRLSANADALDLSQISVSGLEEIQGAAGNDTITATTADDRINGGGGNDTLIGGGGNDDFLVVGNGGLDDLVGGEGSDRILGSAGDDLIGLLRGALSLDGVETIDGGDGFDVLRLSAGDDALDLSAYSVVSIEEVRGGGGADQITGTSGDDTINGGVGGDTLIGGEGNDTFLVIGGNGFDSISGGGGFDHVLGGVGNDTFRFASVAGNLDGVELIDGGGGIDSIVLSAGDDTLDLSAIAVTGISQISAGGGNDRLVASLSNDVLRGGGGSDTFVFRHGFGNDVIADFQRGTAANPLVDVVDLANFGFADFADLMSQATQDGTDTVITIDAANSLRLANIAVTSLQADDFRLI